LCGSFPSFLNKPLPIVPGFDFSGRVVEVGAECKRIKVGDLVWGDSGLSIQGTYAEYLAVPEISVALKPTNLSYLEAASCPLAALTSYEVLVDKGHLVAGERVLILGGSGGTGSFAIQLAKYLGASFVAATASARNVEFLRALGADRAVDYNSENWADLPNEEGNFDLIYDCVGGRESFDAAVAHFAKNNKPGRYLTIAGDTQDGVWSAICFGGNIIGRKIKAAMGYGPTYDFVFTDSRRPDILDKLKEAIEAGKIKTNLEKVFEFEQVGDLYESSMQGRTRGKCVLKVADWASEQQ